MSNNWRYSVETDVNGHMTITRGRTYHLDYGDEWSSYWEGSDICAFYDEGFHGLRPADWSDPDEARRATVAYSAEQDDKSGSRDGLKRLAVRLTENGDADFIRVGLDRGRDFYVLSWSGDPEGTWRNEIEAVNEGEVYRIEVEEYVFIRTSALDGDLWMWQTADDVCDQYYGEDNAEAALITMFPETEFPAEMLVTATD